MERVNPAQSNSARVKVELGERSYNISIGTDTLCGLGPALKPLDINPVIGLITNPTVSHYYGHTVMDSLRTSGFEPILITIPDGEQYKDILWAYYIYGEMLSNRLDRSSAIAALGGGVIGDITGFVASTYMRGIPYIQVPTTLLSHVDSSVGGKTGINHPLGKNMIGSFYQPRLVWVDIATLKTLPRREFIAGLAEVIKYGVIADSVLFEYLEDNREKIISLEADTITYIVKRSCEIKASVVAADEKEAGFRAILNYGHTIGHAIETITAYREFLHGEAVAIGMLYAAGIAKDMGMLKEDEFKRISSLIRIYGLPYEIPKDISVPAIHEAVKVDKKRKAGRIRMVLPEGIGRVSIVSLDSIP